MKLQRSYCWMLFQIVYSVVVGSFLWLGLSWAENTCTQAIFKKIKGDCFTAKVLRSDFTGSQSDCGQKCLHQEKCVGFKYRSSTNHEQNCEALWEMNNCNEKGNEKESKAWKFFKIVKPKLPDVCSKHNMCKNGGSCVADPCLSDGFKCVCTEKFSDQFCEDVTGTFASCKELLQTSSDVPNGVYNIQTETDSGFTKTYCQMTSFEGCAGGGWTMVMKVNGVKDTFRYNSTYWSNKQTFNVIGGTSGFDEVETKLPTYWSTSFNELCIGMKVGADLRFLTIPQASQSLYSLIADGAFRATDVGRGKWKSLLAHSSLQLHCNREGLNNHVSTSQASVRIGILGNEQNHCDSPDSFLGIGIEKITLYEYCPISDSGVPTSGNIAMCSPDNGPKNIKSIGYILVR